MINNTTSAEKFLEAHDSLNEELMNELGVTIIWYESHDEIPEILKSISNEKLTTRRTPINALRAFIGEFKR